MNLNIDEANSELHDVQVCAVGKAAGHDIYLDEGFLDDVVRLCKNATVKVRVNHPQGSGNVLSIIGEASGFYIDGNVCRARTIKLFDLPDRTRMLQLAKEAWHLFGLSLDFTGRKLKRVVDGATVIACEVIHGLDFVDTPAATRALFSASADTTNRFSVATCMDSRPCHDNTNEDLPAMMKALLAKLFKRFEIDPKTDAAEKLLLARLCEKFKVEPDKDNKATWAKLSAALSLDQGDDDFATLFEAKLAVADAAEKPKVTLEGLSARFDDIEQKFNKLFERLAADDEDGKDGKDGKDDEDGDGKDKKGLSAGMRQEIVRLTASEFTRLAAKVGIHHEGRPSHPKDEHEDDNTAPKLTEEQKQIAAKLGLDEKLYAANLGKERARVQV
jgi:hypothetical protein